MSGFALAMDRRGLPGSVEDANRMRDALQVFGGDRKAAEAVGPFALSWTFDSGFTSQDRSERQPVQAGERWYLLFVGRLNHRAELAQKLGIPDQELTQIPDCDLAMQAWLKWRLECRDQLYGKFSFVVCDARERQLTAISSHERPQKLYFYQDANRFVIATSTKAIFSFPDVPKRIDDVKIADALVLNYEDINRTYFQGISALGIGQTLEVRPDGEPRLISHDIFARIKPIRFTKDADYVEHAREHVDRAIAAAFRSSQTPALSLSGGLDSTTLAVAMIEHLRKQGGAGAKSIKAYVGVPERDWDGVVRPNWMGDESGPVKALCAMYPELDVTFVAPDYTSFDQSLDLIHSYADMPIRGVGNSSWGAAIKQQCRRDGQKILINGGAGNGNISFAAAHILFARWLRSGDWITLARELRQFGRNRPESRISSTLLQALVTNLPDTLFNTYLRWRGHDRTTGFAYFSAIHPDFAGDMKVEQRMRDMDWDDRYRRRPDRREMMRIMMSHGARNDGSGLQEATKAMTGIDNIGPFDDRKITEFCYAIPDDQFYKNGEDRRLIRRMMKDKLPREVLKAPRGEQAADWHSKRKRDLPRILEELDRLQDLPEVASRLDIARMQRVTREWPDKTPTSPADYPDYAIARYGIGRALSVARFINQVEGRN